MRTRLPVAIAFTLSFLSGSRAWAQPSDAPTQADQLAAVAEFSAGRTFFEAGDCKNAIPHFIASLARAPGVGARFSLAECSAREGREAEARNHYRAAEQLAITKADNPRARLAQAAAADLERRVTIVRVVLPSDVPITFTIDGVTIDAADHWLLASGYALEPGKPHTLSASTPGRAPWEQRGVQGDRGVELAPLVVVFGAAAAAPAGKSEGPEKAQQDAASTSPLRTTSLVAGGVGVAALVTGGVFVVLARAAKSDAESACDSGPGFSYPHMCNPSRRDDVSSASSSARTDAAVATVAFVAGALLVSTAAVLFFVSGNKPTSSVARAVLTGSF